MTFVFLIFRNNTRGRITRSSKIEGLKSMMGCPKQEGVRISSVSSSECSLRFRNSCLENRANRPIYPVFWALFSFYPVFLKLA